MRRLEAWLLAGAMAICSTAWAQVQVLGFTLGVSSVEEVRKKLANQTTVSDAGSNRYTSGPMLRTSGSGYEIESLKDVLYIFDREEKLAGVVMTMGQHKFNHIYSFVSSKYKLQAEQRPLVGNKFARFGAPTAVIELEAPHLSFDLEVRYLRRDLFDSFKQQTKQEAEQKRRTERSRF